MSLGGKIAFNTFISVLGRVTGTIVALFVISLMTRYLGPTGYGQYATILAFLYFFNIFADWGLYLILTREISQHPEKEGEITGKIFTLRIIIIFLTTIPFSVISLLFPYPFVIKTGIIFGMIAYFFMSSSQVLMGIFQKKLKMHQVAVAEMLGRMGQLLLTIAVIKLGGGLLSFVGALIGGTGLTFFWNFFHAQKQIPFSLQIDWQYFRKILRFALPLSISLILTSVYFRVDTVLLSLFQKEKDVGFYGLAYKILESIIFFPAAFSGIMLPILSQTFVNNFEKFKRFAQKTYNFLLILAFPLIFGGYFTASQIIHLIGGPGYEESIPILQILLVATALIFLGTFFGHLVIVLNEQKKMAWGYCICMIFNLAANITFIPKYSYWAAAWITVATEFLALIIGAAIVFWRIHYLPKQNIFIKSLFASLIMAFALYFSPNKQLLFLMGVGIIVYFAVLYLFGGIQKDEIKSIMGIKNVSS